MAAQLMTEEQIERGVCVRTDALDRRYTASAMTEAEYKAGLKLIDDWAARQMRMVVKGGR